jgi:phosphomannomutase
VWPIGHVFSIGAVALRLKPQTTQALGRGGQGDGPQGAVDAQTLQRRHVAHVKGWLGVMGAEGGLIVACLWVGFGLVSNRRRLQSGQNVRIGLLLIFNPFHFFVLMQVTPSIFKAYDIRGIVPATLNEQVAEGLGKAFGTVALAEGQTTVAVGRDGRLSGPALSAALIRGLVAAGVQVIDIGMATTPMLYFAANTACQSGIQVTGSHNPKDYNGFKMVLAGRAIYGDEIQALRQMMETETWQLQAGGGVSHLDVLADYTQRIVGDIRLSRPMKIVVDSGNGIAGASAPGIFRALGCEVIELFSEVDGEFPNHHPDPSKPENLQDLMQALKTTGAELGLAFDGDGDRLGIVTKDGNNIYPDRQMQLFVEDVLQRVPGGTILFDVKCSQRLAPAIEAAGGKALMYKTGHSLIKAQMKAIEAAGGQAPLGGEMSGHIFFKERWYGFDDGTYAGCRLLEIVSKRPDANAVLNALPSSFSTPELNVACAEGEPHTVTKALQDKAGSTFSAPAKVSDIDGLRVDWPDGFGLIRASNTTPVLVLRFEGQTEAALHRIEADMLALLRSVKPDAQIGAAAH